MINTVEKIYSPIGPSYFNFKVTNQDETILWVPDDEANRDYQAIQEWIADGGTVIDNGAE
tara:strand:- start:46 stop:225 length:180 start_codon:yes stop_codon:yes gene_type:complete